MTSSTVRKYRYEIYETRDMARTNPQILDAVSPRDKEPALPLLLNGALAGQKPEPSRKIARVATETKWKK